MRAREEERVDKKAALEAKDTERKHGSGTEHITVGELEKGDDCLGEPYGRKWLAVRHEAGDSDRLSPGPGGNSGLATVCPHFLARRALLHASGSAGSGHTPPCVCVTIKKAVCNRACPYIC